MLSLPGCSAASIAPGIGPLRRTPEGDTMAVWRMTMRVTATGFDLWQECKRAGVAAIAYRPMAGVDLARFDEGEPREKWLTLKPAQRGFLKRIAYEMKKGDMIYAKQGSKIVGRGVVTGGYRFDRKGKIKDPADPSLPYAHQVRVKWDERFEELPIVLGADITTVLRLEGKRLKRLEAAIQRRKSRRKR